MVIEKSMLDPQNRFIESLNVLIFKNKCGGGSGVKPNNVNE